MVSGSLQAKNGKYYAVLRVPDENGKIRQKWVSTGIKEKGNNRREAKRALHEIIARYSEQKIIYTKEILFVDWINKWMEQKKNDVRQNTYEIYQLYVRVHIMPFFQPMNLTLSRVTSQHIQDYYTAKLNENQTANTIWKHNVILRGALNEAVKKSMIPFNPADRATLPSKVRFVGKAYTIEQAKQLLVVVENDPLKPAVILALFYGMRRSEVLGLRWQDVDFTDGTIKIRNTVVKAVTKEIEHEKTKSRASNRTLTIIPETRDYLYNLKKKHEENREMIGNSYEETDRVCVWGDGKPFKTNYVSHHFALLLKKNGLPHIRFHELRHTTGSILMNYGLSAKQIQEYLGHEQISTTLDIYGHLDYAGKTQAANTIGGLLEILPDVTKNPPEKPSDKPRLKLRVRGLVRK